VVKRLIGQRFYNSGCSLASSETCSLFVNCEGDSSIRYVMQVKIYLKCLPLYIVCSDIVALLRIFK
jgi:hypothetical protein